jgi:hypothetical protein
MRAKIGKYLIELYRLTGKRTFVMPMKRNDWPISSTFPAQPCRGSWGGCAHEGLLDFYRSSVKIMDLEGLLKATE